MIKKIKLDSIPAGANPYWHDAYQWDSACSFGKSDEEWTVMHDSSCEYLILVHLKSGERVKIVHAAK